MDLIQHLNWRYATKKFDATKKIAPADLEKIKEAVRLSASSYGLQLYKIFIIEDQNLKAQLKSASWDQSQVTDASQLVVFCNYKTVLPEHIDAYVTLKAEVQGLDIEQLKGYGDFMKTKIAENEPEAIKQWTAKQVYIALGNLLTVCATLQIDSCPMEGFDPEKYDEILELDKQGLTTAVVATIGYRSSEDKTQHAPKVRKPKAVLFETL